MGYKTAFSGTLRFTDKSPFAIIAVLKKLYALNSRDQQGNHEWNYIGFRVNGDCSGIDWDGLENLYGAVEAINWIISTIREGSQQLSIEGIPDFGLEGYLYAQGEDVGDVWILRMVDGRATRFEIPAPGHEMECPHCHKEFQV